MSARDEVIKAIEFKAPRYVPLWYINDDLEKGDIANYWLFALGKGQTTEWGYQYAHTKEDNGTMGMPGHPVIPDWDAYKKYDFPDPRSLKKYDGVDDFMRENKNRYRVASMGISGFNTYLFLRGFEHAMVDFARKDMMAMDLIERIFQTETEIINVTSKHDFDAIMFYDDWGMQKDIMVSPLMWRKIFRPLYEKQFKTIHDLGMHVFFHSCGDITAIIEDFHDIGVDVMNMGQPNVIDIDKISHALKGKQCFLTPVSYQTVSISGTPQDIKREAKRLYEKLATKDGGMIGWIEEYSSIGMPRKNYLACAQAFKRLTKQ